MTCMGSSTSAHDLHTGLFTCRGRKCCKLLKRVMTLPAVAIPFLQCGVLRYDAHSDAGDSMR